MCKFKSGIAVRINESEVSVMVLDGLDNHSSIREKCNIKEADLGLSRYSIPVELIPTKLDFDDRSCWEFVFDADKPDWWTDGMTEQCFDQLLTAAKADFEAMMNGQKRERDLNLSNLTSIPEGFNPTVRGSLWLDKLTSIPEGFNPIVGLSLILDNLTSIPKGFNPTVRGNLWLNRLTSIPEGFNPTVGGALLLDGLTSISEGFNPTVGENLYLMGCTSIPEELKKNVKGNIYSSAKPESEWGI
jgi:hypothetical protein